MATALPPDFFVKQQQFVPTIYRDQYPSIDPSSPRLSQAGKTVVITGATQGIGQVRVYYRPSIEIQRAGTSVG